MDESNRKGRTVNDFSWKTTLIIFGCGVGVLGLVKLLPEKEQGAKSEMTTKNHKAYKKIPPREGVVKIGMICPGFKNEDDLDAFAGLKGAAAEEYVAAGQRMKTATVLFKNDAVTIIDSTWTGKRKVLDNKTGGEWWISGEWIEL